MRIAKWTIGGLRVKRGQFLLLISHEKGNLVMEYLSNKTDR